MSENKKTPTPWVLDESGIRSEKLDWYLASRDEVTLADCEAIVSAVNGTYGKGIHPDAVEDLLKSLKEVISVSDRKTDIYDRAKAAIEKAKL